MTVYLPPFEVILQDLQIWIEDDPGIKWWQLFNWKIFKILRPVMQIGCCEGWYDTGFNFVDSSVEELCGFFKSKWIFVWLPVCQKYFIELFAYMESCLIHKLNCSQVIWFLEMMGITELGKAPAIDSDNHKGFGKGHAMFFILFYVFVFGACHPQDQAYIIIVVYYFLL